MRRVTVVGAALLLTACTSAEAGCKYDKIKIGMTEADVSDICGCGEPDERVLTRSKDADKVVLTFRPEHYSSYAVYSGYINNGQAYTPPPRTSSDTLSVTLEGDHVTSVVKDTTWTGVSR